MQAPAWKIGTSKRNPSNNSFASAVPGPGQYSQQNQTAITGSGKNKTSSQSFGNSPRINSKNLIKTLGPGSYDNKSFIEEGPKQSARVRTESVLRDKVRVPGPGTYDIGTTKNKISFSFGARTAQGSKGFTTPGPGMYSTMQNQTEGSNPTWKIGSGTRNYKDLNKAFPGPGKQGEQDQQLVGSRKKTPNWVFGKEERGRTPSPTKHFPGPGTYALKNTIGDLPSYARN